MEILKNCSLKEYNTFDIDASANLLVKYSSEEELLTFLERYHREMSHLPLLHIGSGSNLLFLSDFSGVILFSKIIATFAPASPMPSRPQPRNGVVEKGRSTTYWKVFANACFCPFERRKLKLGIQRQCRGGCCG